MSISSIKLINPEDVADTFKVKRTFRIWIPYNRLISNLCHLSKNLWNQAQHIVEKEYEEFNRVPSYEDIDTMLNKKSYYKNSDFDNYHKLPTATSQQILKVHNKSWKSFLVSIKDYSKNLDRYLGKPKPPKYKKKDGENLLIFTNQQIKFRETKSGNVYLKFPKKIKIEDKNNKHKPLEIKLGNIFDISYIINRLMFTKFDQVRIIPIGTG